MKNVEAMILEAMKTKKNVESDICEVKANDKEITLIIMDEMIFCYSIECSTLMLPDWTMVENVKCEDLPSHLNRLDIVEMAA